MKPTGDRAKGLGMDSACAVSIKVKLDMVVPLASCLEVLGPPRYPQVCTRSSAVRIRSNFLCAEQDGESYPEPIGDG